MKTHLRKLGSAATAAGVAAAALMIGISSASASGTPPYEPDAADQLGTLAFYDAAGVQVTSGSTTAAPFATYAVASTGDPIATNTKATLYGYLPVSGQPAGAWSGEVLSGSTSFPVASAPGAVASAGSHPVVTQSTADVTLAQLVTDYPNKATDTYSGLYQIRLKTAGNQQWWAADLQISGGTWTEVFPDAGQGTTRTLPTPSLFGAHKIGQVDTCAATHASGETLTYGWYYNGTKIGGQSQTLYRLSDALWNSTLTCRVLASSLGGNPSASSAGAHVGSGAALKATKRSTLVGTHTHGHNEAAKVGTWAPAASSYSYQWYVGSGAIHGATHSVFAVPSSYKGRSINCVVTAHRLHYGNGAYRTAAVRIS